MAAGPDHATRAASPEAARAVASLRGFSKTFAGRTVLDGVDLDVLAGEVHGLLGQNGSGKSTLIKILAGYHAPDDGAALSIAGADVALPLQPGDGHKLGLAFVHQDLGLVPNATVLENLYVGRYETRAGWRVPWAQERERARRALERFGVSVDPDATIASLREVDHAMIGIVRAFEQLREFDRGLLVLDEPTAYLPRDGVGRLFDAVREIAAAGFGVLFVSHRLEEVRTLTDRVSILRDGRLVDTARTADLDEPELIARILGFAMDDLYPTLHQPQGERTLSVRDLSGETVQGLSLDLHRGEVVGLTGLRGMGYEEVPYLLFGEGSAASGSLTLGDREHDIARLTPRQAMKAGMALLPANRLRDGGSSTASVAENMTLATLGSYRRSGALRLRREASRVQQLLEDFQVQPPEGDRPFGTLSGGNQQKVLLAKWFETNPDVFLLHEPTQGVDVGARRQIFRHIAAAAEAGTSFVLASSEYEDLPHLCDRVIVFRDGRPVSELHGAELTHERIVEQCFREGAAA
jgi:ribose transport system ATP-binding protein